MKSIDGSFYRSRIWERCRKEYAKSVGGLCERCYAKGLIVPGVIVHHKIHLNQDNYKDPNIALNFDNLELLCHKCHDDIHIRKREKSRYKISDDGTVTILDDSA